MKNKTAQLSPLRWAVFLLPFLLLGTTLWGQSEAKGIPISIGYFSHAFVQPGVKLGTQLRLKQWNREATRKGTVVERSDELFLSPQIGFFTWPGNNLSGLVNLEAGYLLPHPKHRLYSAFSLGVGYLATFDRESITIGLGDGSTTAAAYNRRDFIVPTLNYELGKHLTSFVGLFVKGSLGQRISFTGNVATAIYLEIGAKFYLPSKQ